MVNSMDSLSVNLKYQSTDVEARFSNRWNMLSGYSGTGKTFLMQAVELFCMDNSINCIYCNYRFKGYDNDQIEKACKNAEVVLLDNADLYLNNELFLWLKETGKLLIICMKDTSKIDMENVHKYIVNYENKMVSVEEF